MHLGTAGVGDDGGVAAHGDDAPSLAAHHVPGARKGISPIRTPQNMQVHAFLWERSYQQLKLAQLLAPFSLWVRP
jgi:hypothetical protein